MRNYFVLLFIAVIGITVNAQESANSFRQDTIEKNVLLDEVFVKAPEIIQRGDKRVYFPNSDHKKLSQNGLVLLERMQLTGVQINTLFNTVTVSGGGNAIFCINGRIVDLKDILSLKPDEVARIEYNDNPGARFKDAAVVINFKLKKAVNGGGFMADIMEAFNTVYGVNHLSGKYNFKNSEFSVNYDLNHALFKEFYNMNDEHYIFNDNEIYQKEIGEPGKLKYDNHWITLNYNYLIENKLMFNAALRGKYLNTPTSQLNSGLSNSTFPSDKCNLHDYSKFKSHNTIVDLYFQRYVSENEILILDVTGGYTSTDNKMDYLIFNNDVVKKQFTNNVDGDKYSIITEGLYEKMLGQNKFTIGLRYNKGYASNNYNDNCLSSNSMHNTEGYLYSEWNQIIDKWSYSLSMGLSYINFSQKNEGYTKLLLNPLIRVGFTPSERFFVRYRGSIENVNPTLSELSNVKQIMDNYQIIHGNPNLKPASSIINQIMLDYHKEKWSTALSFNYIYRSNPIMECSTIEGNTILRSFENQNNWQKFNAEYEFRLKLLSGMINIRAVAGIDRYISTGNDYLHSHTNMYGIMNFAAAYKFIALNFNMRTHRPTLYGETLELGEDLHDIAVTYFKKTLSITFAMNNPFMNNYKIGKENWNRYGNSKNYRFINETSKMMLIKVAYGMNFGKKHNSIKQRIHNEDIDTGVLDSSK